MFEKHKIRRFQVISDIRIFVHFGIEHQKGKWLIFIKLSDDVNILCILFYGNLQTLVKLYNLMFDISIFLHICLKWFVREIMLKLNYEFELILLALSPSSD